MLLVRCGHCAQTLQIDNVFAGGVCRCRYCGTIQTVPEDVPVLADPEPAAVDEAAATVEKRPLPIPPYIGYGHGDDAGPSHGGRSDQWNGSAELPAARPVRRRWVSILRLGFAAAMIILATGAATQLLRSDLPSVADQQAEPATAYVQSAQVVQADLGNMAP